MKNYLLYIFLVVAALGVSACDEELNLEPYQSISEDLALDSDNNVKAVLTGAYDGLGNGDVLGGNALRNSELLGGDGEIVWVGTFAGPREIANKQMTIGNLDAQELWLDAYTAINRANNVLTGLGVVVEDDKASVEGEALFIRAICFFELVRFYGKPYEAGQANAQLGVPLVLTPTRGISEESKLPRNTVAEVYAQVIQDLTKAESLLPSENEWRANKGAAAALLARIYLQQGDYAKARDAANRVIESGDFQLLADYGNVFNRDENSSEDIFAIQVTTQDGINNMNTFFSIPEFGGRDGDIEILEGHLSLYDPADDRLKFFFDGNGAIRSGKWNNQFGNVGILRLAEMYLIRAESNQRLGTAIGATPLADYNTVHTRAGLPAANSVTLNQILLERRLELAREGFKIHDMKRLKQSVATLAYNADKLVFPIPQREVDANSNLLQNGGY
ncbi:MAG: RagB/SusD family nutrient uptake outer membrane protein [Haliscomenobacter sp.]|nr:RagB/SusD family nutrient uptake outer membrane protein [Haliscomenobacter sp.]